MSHANLEISVRVGCNNFGALAPETVFSLFTFYFLPKHCVQTQSVTFKKLVGVKPQLTVNKKESRNVTLFY